MAKCKRCGIKLNFLSFSSYCDRCQALIEVEEQLKKQRRELEKKKRIQELTEKKNMIKKMIIERTIASVQKELDNGNKIFLYKKIYVSVDSMISENNEPVGLSRFFGKFKFGSLFSDNFDISILRYLGISGWEVVGIVPQTVGIALTNKDIAGNISWGAGLGGNIKGVYILLKKEIINLTSHKNLLQKYIEEYWESFATYDELEELKSLSKQLQELS